jgi:hypothetical protein
MPLFVTVGCDQRYIVEFLNVNLNYFCLATDLPMGRAPLDMICCGECGEIIHQIFLRPDEFRGKWMALASSRMTIQEYAASLTKVTGRKFVAGTVSIFNS